MELYLVNDIVYIFFVIFIPFTVFFEWFFMQIKLLILLNYYYTAYLVFTQLFFGRFVYLTSFFCDKSLFLCNLSVIRQK